MLYVGVWGAAVCVVVIDARVWSEAICEVVLGASDFPMLFQRLRI